MNELLINRERHDYKLEKGLNQGKRKEYLVYHICVVINYSQNTTLIFSSGFCSTP